MNLFFSKKSFIQFLCFHMDHNKRLTWRQPNSLARPSRHIRIQQCAGRPRGCLPTGVVRRPSAMETRVFDCAVIARTNVTNGHGHSLTKTTHTRKLKQTHRQTMKIVSRGNLCNVQTAAKVRKSFNNSSHRRIVKTRALSNSLRIVDYLRYMTRD